MGWAPCPPANPQPLPSGRLRLWSGRGCTSAGKRFRRVHASERALARFALERCGIKCKALLRSQVDVRARDGAVNHWVGARGARSVIFFQPACTAGCSQPSIPHCYLTYGRASAWFMFSSCGFQAGLHFFKMKIHNILKLFLKPVANLQSSTSSLPPPIKPRA